MPPLEEGARKHARVSRGPIVLAAIVNGVSLTEIATTEQIPIKRVERLLREELQNRLIAPAPDYARLQIARLEAIAVVLREKARKGDLPTIDRLLKVLDRLDRYHGFPKLAASTSAPREDVRPQLIAKLEQAARTPARGQ